jgi:SIR2-like domain
MANLPLGLRQVLESGDCVLFIGAGVGRHLKGPDDSSAPDGETLAKELCVRFGIEPESPNLAMVAQLVEIRRSRPDLEGFLRKRLADLEPDDTFRWLTTFRWRAIFTTNYDRSILRAYEMSQDAPQVAVPMSLTSDLEYTDPRLQVPVFYLHGTLFGPSPSHIVITQDDYARFQAKRRMLWDRLKTEFATSTLLYIGYSGRDPNWRLVLDELTQEFDPSPLPQSYRVDPYADPYDIEILGHKHIETIPTDLDGFHLTVKAELGDFRPDPDALSRYRKDVPNDLIGAFEKNPASVLRLLASWEYVNAANFHEPANTRDFLKGDRPTWSLVGKNVQFKRDIEEEVWNDILEFATDPTGNSRALAVIAPAGYGVSTVLMSLAAQIVKANTGPVFMLRASAQVLEADAVFAASIYPDSSTFLVVDQAREQASAVATAISQSKRNCLFILGERKNEWRTARFRTRVNEYEIEPLSDSEIDRLLDYLTRENALNKLGQLDRDLQFAVVKEKHEKELLVAMREATEGDNFDAIIEDEYRGIPDESGTGFARNFYLLTSCFYQSGLYLRDQLAAGILGISVQDLYEELADSLEGIVSFIETDAARGEYAARTRHRVIAEVVWKRCGEPNLKERILQTAMEMLNLSYRLDKAIFERFVRTDDVVGTFRTFESKTKFFETACKRDSGNPYVLQHFARMLRRERKWNLALAQIDAAIKMAESVRVFHHTRGSILADLAVAADSDDVGRKWMLQSEHEFERCIETNPKDHYGHSGLAQLYLQWAEKVQSEDESSDYLTKCEAAISEALRVVRDRESLWVISADVQEFLGNNPGRIEKLKKAVAESSTSVVPRYLLGRAYRKQGQAERCMEVLAPVIKTNFREFRSFIEYVRAMLELGESYSKCAAVLYQSQLDGITDPIFVGLLGGLLFMDEKFSEAQKVFNESIRQGFTFDQRTKLQFRPVDPVSKARLQLAGRVVAVKPGFIFVQNERYPQFFAPTTRIGKTVLQTGMRIQFEPAFSARGPVADHVQLDESANSIATMRAS